MKKITEETFDFVRTRAQPAIAEKRLMKRRDPTVMIALDSNELG